ncbi:YchJ family protein [Luteipulveratus mongoliensis]|uniref:Zinc chelation protein SecC n=1 Tax=Luteipulveratus mongoliensis TaxID=571913 RepID=A0A0K1JJ25_9MICO|nr:YchJ family metal-binding protein [Luteipulveratus mongoliensis]AKU16696.1 zinc chelation protein SecC [Luteipulveratus mongoliensis]
MPDDDLCPCGSNRSYDSCCGPLLSTERLAATAEELMRSRYTAYFYGNREHLWRTWHPRTRPAEVVIDAATRWTGLRIDEVVGGGADDDEGVVEFTASHTGGALHERSTFARRGGRWFYLDAE